MAIKAPVGGGNYLEIFGFSAGTVGSSEFVFDKTVTTSVNGHPAKGVDFTIDLDSKINNETFETFLVSYLTSISTETLEFTYEDDTKDVSSSAADEVPKFAFMLYNKALGGKRKVLYGVGYLSGDSGNDSRAAGALNTTPVQLTVTAYADASVAFGTTLFNTELVTGTALTLATGATGKYTFMTTI